MKKLYNLLFVTLLMLAWSHATAQTYRSNTVIWKTNIPGLEIPPLIFTEFRGDNNAFYYLELTNVGQEALDLSNFSILSVGTYTALENATTDTTKSLRRNWHYIPLEGTLPAGESYVMTNVFDESNAIYNGLPRHDVGILDVADRIFHQPENLATEFMNKPEWEAYDKDSVSTYYPMTFLSGSSGYYLEYKFTDSESNRDSTIIDNVNVSIDPFFFDGRGDQGNYQTPVAGIIDAIANYILVRKSTVTQGNVDWDLARGTDLATSEWLPIPAFYDKLSVYTTAGVHGNYSVDFTVNSPDKVTVNDAEKIITVPWEANRGERLSREFTFKENMSWSYTENATDSSYTNVRDGDIFTLYALGEGIEQVDYTIQVSPPAANVAVVFPKRYQVTIIDFDSGDEFSYWNDFYSVTQGLEMDSIYNVQYGTRKDTLLKYLDKPELATWEIITGTETRADLKDGDILRVTSQDGSVVKEYEIKVDDYLPSSNANLSMISWADVDLDTYWQWESDTIPGFTPQAGSYFIQLLDGATAIPALQFRTQDVNAKFEVTRATDINGTLEQRTTEVVVTAEDGVTTKTYTIEFQIESVPVQPNFAEPFISELTLGMNFAYNVEIYNPGNQELDLNRYMLVRGGLNDNFGNAITGITTNNLNNIYRNHYVPGMRYKNDDNLAAYQANPGYLTPDNVTNTIVQPGDVFVAGSSNDGGWPGGRFYPSRYFEGYTLGEKHDFIWYGWSFQEPNSSPTSSVNDAYNLNPWGRKLHRYYNPAYQDQNTSLFLVKILNDEVLAGTKQVTDPNDYEIIDRWQKPLEADSFFVSGRYIAEYGPANSWAAIRKPHVWSGTTERGDGFGDNLGKSAENSEWVFFNSRDSDKNNWDLINSVGWHSMNPVPTYVSTITSTRFLVTPGYEGDLTITGSIDGLTVSEITALIDQADPGQTMVFINGTDTFDTSDAVAGGMNLVVTSTDGNNTTTYTLVNAPLDSDNLLVAENGSGLTVSLSGTDGSVGGVAIGTTIRSLVDNLIVPEKAVMNIIDANNNLVSLQTINFDSVMVDRVVSTEVFLEVIAENSDVAIYSLDFGLAGSDAFLFSDILNINQETMVVYGIPEGISVAGMMEIVYPNTNATMKVFDKNGFERTMGNLYPDDVIEVTSADQSVTVPYSLNFTYEVNQAPVASISGPTEAVIGEVQNYAATVNDDGLPEGSTLTYLWEITTGNAADVTIATADQLTTDITFNAAGTYELSFTASDSELSTTVTTTITSAVGINGFDWSSVKVYPNPASDVLYVEFGSVNNAEARLRILDITGRVVYNAANLNDKGEIGLQGFDTGVYFLSIEIENEVSIHKINILK